MRIGTTEYVCFTRLARLNDHDNDRLNNGQARKTIASFTCCTTDNGRKKPSSRQVAIDDEDDRAETIRLPLPNEQDFRVEAEDITVNR